jgi:hypothetical protein
MNPELHHKWNAERDGSRHSAGKAEPILKEEVQKNSILLKQNKPR